MPKRLFFSFAAIIALCVGLFALALPGLLLESKGVPNIPQTAIWVRQTGAALIAISLVAWQMRSAPDSLLAKAFLLGNLGLQLTLVAIEVIAYQANIISKLLGIAPNSILHIVLAIGFAFYLFNPETTKE